MQRPHLDASNLANPIRRLPDDKMEPSPNMRSENYDSYFLVPLITINRPYYSASRSNWEYMLVHHRCRIATRPRPSRSTSLSTEDASSLADYFEGLVRGPIH
ncbi:hypothetical protein ACVIWU_005801 [Bradyrhizobium sp. USDA 4509]|nr:hypothetical protein [Bradyrhizobium elkanii]